MKVILQERVSRLGDKGDVVDVANGYAQNFLIPRHLAYPASDHDVDHFVARKEERDARRAEYEAQLAGAVSGIKGVRIELTGPAGTNGHLYAGIHADEIAQAVSKHLDMVIEPQHIHLDGPVKEVGEHEIELHVGDVRSQITLVVSPQEDK